MEKRKPNNVKIEAQTVNVRSASTSNIKKKNKHEKGQRKRARKTRDQYDPDPGVQSGMAKPSTHDSRFDQMSDQAKQFAILYTDPCGEHTHSTDAARVPDGATQSSVGGFFRYTDSIKFPWQSDGETDLTGKTYSMLYLGLPILRSLGVIVAREKGGEFDDNVMAAVTNTWGISSIEQLAYPNWIQVDIETGTYMTVIDTVAMRNIVPPDVNGVSGLVDSYRFTSYGTNIWFNTPDLLNQGTFVANRYPTNSARKVYQMNSGVFGTPRFVNNRASPRRGESGHAVTIGERPTGGQVVLPFYVGDSSDLPSPNFVVTLSNRVRSNDNPDFVLSNLPGQIMRYERADNEIFLVNVTLNQKLVVIRLGTGITISQTRYYLAAQSDAEEEEVFEEEFNTLVLPPVTQNDILQQNPKAIVVLGKEFDGIYAPNAIFQPVFNLTHAASYAKTLLLSKGSDIKQDLDYETGWFDTIDENFGTTVVNIQSMPYACVPQFKICRSVEFVASPGSILGTFTTGSPVIQPEVIDVVKSMSDVFPQAWPSSFNSLGLLFAKVCKVIEKIPRFVRLGRNVATAVNDVVESPDVQEIIAPVTHGLRRLRR